MVFMAPAMLFAALVPVGALLFVQAEHDTRGFTDVPSPDEAVAEQIRKQNAAGNGTRRDYASGTRSREVILKGGAGDLASYDRRSDYVRYALPVPTAPIEAMGAPMGGAPGTEMTPQECAALGLPPGSRWKAQNASSGIRGYEQQGLSTRSSYQSGGTQIGGDATAGDMRTSYRGGPVRGSKRICG